MGKNSKTRAEMTTDAWAAVSATGEDLESIGNKYTLARHPVETDQAFRRRVQAEIQRRYHAVTDEVTVTMTVAPDRLCGNCKHAVFGATGNYCKIDKSPIKSDGKCHNSEFEVYVKKIACDGKSFDCNPDESPCTKCDPKDRNCAVKDCDTDCDTGGWWDPSSGAQLSQLEFLIGEIEHRFPTGIRSATPDTLINYLKSYRNSLHDLKHRHTFCVDQHLNVYWDIAGNAVKHSQVFSTSKNAIFAMRILNEALGEYENYKNTVAHPPQTSPTVYGHSGSGNLKFSKTRAWFALNHDQATLLINDK